jgi:hypothetical protein
MPLLGSVKVFRGDTAVDIEVLRRATEVVFGSEREEQECQKLDWLLYEQVCNVLSGASASFYVIEDWWPNRTKAVEADETALKPAVVSALQSLLVGPYAQRSIAIEVYRGLGQDRAEGLGPIRIYGNEVLTIQKLVGLVAAAA